MEPVLSSVDLVTCDVAESSAFYRRLGLEVVSWPEKGEPHHVTMRMPGGIELMLNSVKLARSYDANANDRGRAYLIFSLPSREAVDRRFDELISAGHAAISAPFDAFWGARYAIVADPGGIAVGLMGPSDGEHTEAPSLTDG